MFIWILVQTWYLPGWTTDIVLGAARMLNCWLAPIGTGKPSHGNTVLKELIKN
jgi:hypothetical protein